MIELGGIPAAAVGVRGTIPALLIAPHGGRRPPASEVESGPGRKVNDLHTAAITLELAGRTGASAIVNRGQDRNELDWNRTSDVRANAGWLLDLLLDSVRRQIEAAGCASLVFVHGWNAIQPSCDVGIGARIEGGKLVGVKQGVPTVPEGFLPRLARFVACARGEGIDVTIGHRYPAAGRDNLLQMFTRRFAGDADPRVRELAALGDSGRVAAVQLELAVPLRWPGPWRERILGAISGLVVGDASAEDLPALHHEDPCAVDPDHIALEFHDGNHGVGGFTAFEQTPNGHRAGRLLLCLGTRELGLFTGERRGGTPTPLRCLGLGWRRGDGGEVRVEFEGPCLSFPRTDPFLDLERGLADADLADLAVDLRWTPSAHAGPDAPAQAGRIEGRIRLGGFSTEVDAAAALRDRALGGSAPWRERSAFHVPLGDDVCLSVRTRATEGERISGVVTTGERVEALLSGTLSTRLAPDGLLPEAWRLEAVSRSTTWRVLGRVTHSIPVVRPGPDGRVLTVFGLARFSCGERVGYGTFERSRRLDSERSGS